MTAQGAPTCPYAPLRAPTRPYVPLRAPSRRSGQGRFAAGFFAQAATGPVDYRGGG
jgi:hypothetical protein